MGIDMSYRDTGVAVAQYHDDSLYTEHIVCLKNPALGYGFNALHESMRSMKYNTMSTIRALYKEYNPDVVVVEMPCFTQNAKGALSIGMCWGFVSTINAVLVEPSALKIWSGSKRGDKKEKVKEKVLERISNFKDMHNDNAYDALGLVFMTSDLINRTRYEEKNIMAPTQEI